MSRDGARPWFMAFDFSCVGSVHAPFNLGVLATLRAARPDGRITCWCEPGHARALLEAGADALGVEFEAAPMLPASGGGRTGSRPRRVAAAAYMDFLIDRCAREAPALAIALCATPEMAAVARRRWRDGRLDLIFHATLAEVAGWRSRNPLHRWFDTEAEIGRRGRPGIRYVVLEEAVLRNLRARFPARRDDAIVLPHPVRQRRPTRIAPPAGAKLRIGHVGYANSEKGFELFLSLAERHAGAAMGFHAIGSGSDPAWCRAAALATPPSAAPLSDAAYCAGLATLDLVCLPLDRHRYSWTASGSLVDCIDFGVPVLVSPTDVVADLFERYGPLGVICDGDAQFHDFFASHPPDRMRARLAQFERNLLRARADRVPEALARAYPGI